MTKKKTEGHIFYSLTFFFTSFGIMFDAEADNWIKRYLGGWIINYLSRIVYLSFNVMVPFMVGILYGRVLRSFA